MIGHTEIVLSELLPTVLFYRAKEGQYQGWVKITEATRTLKRNRALALPIMYVPFTYNARSIGLPSGDLVFAMNDRMGTKIVPFPTGQVKKQKIEATVEGISEATINQMLRDASAYPTATRKASSIRGGFSPAIRTIALPPEVYHAH